MTNFTIKHNLARTALLLLTMLCCLSGARAQETVEIGVGGTTNNSYLPSYSLYNYSLTQQIYTADEIGMAGTINSIAFKNTGAEKTRTYNVYMLLTDKETFESGTDWVAMSDDDLVFAGELTFTVGEWTTIVLDTPFTYDGSSNLIVGVADVSGAYSSSPHMACLVFDATSQAIRAYRDNGSYDITAPGVTGSVLNVKNQIQLEITPAGGSICAKPEALTANGEATDSEFSFTIEDGSGLYNIEIKAGNGDWTEWEYEYEETTVDLTGLEGNTAYQVRVQSVCDGGATSGWKTLSFTTKYACAAPTNLQVSDITTSSATLSWTPGYQETSWTVKYKKSTDAWDDAVVETVNSSPTITLSNLDGLTIYNVQVYNCENYVSCNFTTAAGIPLNETFATTSVPTGWTRYNTLLTDDVLNGTTALTSYSGGWVFGTNNGVFDSHARVNIYGTSCKYWLVTPNLPMEDNMQLTFDLALTKYSGTLQEIDNTLGEDDKFVVLITTDGGTTWNILRQWDNADSEYVYNNIACSDVGQSVAIDLSSYAGQSIAVAFYGESTVSESGSDNNLHIDNVSIDYIPDCAKPTGLAKSDVTAHEATITWTSDANGWQVQLDDENPIDVEEATYTFENLNPETTYTAKVRANCGGIYSEWTNPVSFTTNIACPAPTALAVTPDALSATFTWESNAGEWEVAYSTDADADPEEFIVGTVNEAAYTVDDLELGDYYFWVRSNCGDVDGNSQWAGPASVHIGYCVPNPTSHDGLGITGVSFGMGDYVVENGGEGISIPATSPYYGDYTDMIGAVQAGVESTISITTATGSYPYTFVIWVDFDNSLSFEDSEIVYIGKASSGAGTLNATITVPATQATGDYRMRIYGADSYFSNFYGNGNTNWDADHDPCSSGSYRHAHDYTLRVLEAPSCLPAGDVTMPLGSITSTSAVISWTNNNGEEATYTVMQGETVLTTTAVDSYELTGLTAATSYPAGTFTIISNCDENMIVNVPAFSTPCADITDLPWSEDFEGIDSNTVPQCWDNSGSGTSTISSSSSYYVWGVYSYSDNNMIRMNNYWVQNGTALINTPRIVLPAGEVFNLSFDYAHNASCGKLIVKISEDGGETFTELASYTQGSGSSYSNPGDFTHATISLADYAGEAIILQFFANANYGNGAIFVDNVEIDKPIVATVAFAPEGYGTFYYGTYDAVLPEDMKAYIVTAKGAGEGELEYQEVTDVVPAATAVLLQVAPSDGVQTIDIDLVAPSAGAISGTNYLYGSDTETTTTGGDKFYKLTYKNGEELGWYWGEEGGLAFTSGAHKAWLALPADGARFFGLPGFDVDNTTTSISEELRVKSEESATGEWYSVDGRKLDKQPTRKGVYLNNGRKVVIK